jgi:Putative Flp pilus-assembly TadE/G-like
MNREDELGYATVLVLGLTLVALGVCALAIDGTRAFILHRSLQNAADAAALAGAGELDRNGLYSTGGTRVELDPNAARSKAAQWLSARGFVLDAGISADEARVRVLLRDDMPTTFLRFIGISHVPVGADSTAGPRPGDI